MIKQEVKVSAVLRLLGVMVDFLYEDSIEQNIGFKLDEVIIKNYLLYMAVKV